uniref:RNA helicase n=1 Tax=Drosophila rhopaloa TaxID=1041015 RepID=A0A6P4FQ27_DRORH
MEGQTQAEARIDPNYAEGDSYSAEDAIRPLVATNCSIYVVAHSTRAMQPARRFSEVVMMPHILETMRQLGLNRLMRLQSYTWPHLGAGLGHGALIVGAPRSGRTLAFVPSVCQAVCKSLTENRQRRMQHTGKWQPDELGALALILVPDLQRVRHVSALCHALLRKSHTEDWVTLVLNIPSANSEHYLRLLNVVGCLVATPVQLTSLCREMPGLLRFPRLQFLVFDDVDLMPADQLRNAQQVLQEILPTTHFPQLVMVSQSYSDTWMAKLGAVSDHPAVVFGDILEAALYGGTRIRISLIRSKSSEVVQLLQQRPPQDYRTVIYCRDDEEMGRLVADLEDHDFACLPYYQNSNLEDHEKVHSWMARSGGLILLCTDGCPELTIRNAHTLIHHGLSSTWSRFKMRHLMLSDNLNNKLDFTPGKSSSLPLLSQVLLDNSNQRQLPRLVDFLQLHQQVDPDVAALAQRMRKEAQSARSNKHALCGQILMLGECRDPTCEDRHHVADVDRRPSYVPASGDVKVELVRVYSPTHFCVRLQEHLPIRGTWKVLPHLAVQEMRLKLRQEMEPKRYWPPVAGAICMLHTMDDKERVQVLKVDPIEDVNILQSNLTVEVQALDVDTRILVTKSGGLFECSKAVQQEPPMAIDMRLLGMIPKSGESSWTEEDRLHVELLLTKMPKNHFLQANIQFATAKTLFVHDLVAMMYADNFKVHVRHLSLGQKLIQKNLARRCEQAKLKIKDFFEENLTKDEAVQQEVEKKVTKILIEENKETNEQTQENTPRKLDNNLVDNECSQLQNTQLLPPRCLRLIQMAREMAAENEQKIKSTMSLKSSNQMEISSPENKENSMTEIKEDGMNQLYKCMMNCAMLQFQDNKLSVKDTNLVANNPVEFLDNVIRGGSTGGDLPPLNQKSKKKSKAKKAKFKEEIPLQTHPNVVRPEVTYHQSVTTLELQVCLPEDDHEYKAMLQEGQIFFRATSKTSDLIYQFILTLKFPYSTMDDHMSGRTVYISIVKSLAIIYPLDFGEYRFMKPNHEMFAKLDDYRHGKHVSLKGFLKDRVYVKQKVNLQENSDISDDEERNLDGIERVVHDQIFH